MLNDSLKDLRRIVIRNTERLCERIHNAVHVDTLIIPIPFSSVLVCNGVHAVLDAVACLDKRVKQIVKRRCRDVVKTVILLSKDDPCKYVVDLAAERYH